MSTNFDELAGVLAIYGNRDAENITLRFPGEPRGMTPNDAFCGHCHMPLLHGDHEPHGEELPFQLPCGCVIHGDCIAFWFETEMNASPRSDDGVHSVCLTCPVCDGMIDHPDLKWQEGITEPLTRLFYKKQDNFLVVNIAIVPALSSTWTCDPKDTSFFNPHQPMPELE